MNYFKNIELNVKDYKDPYDMYPDMDEKDVVPAAYRNVYGETGNPDICALPPVLEGCDLMLNSMRTPSYSEDTLLKMQKSERLFHLAGLKDEIKVFLPYQAQLEKRVAECLVSAYKGRKLGYQTNDIKGELVQDQDENVLVSASNYISGSVQDMSVIGTAGTGKSSSVELLTSRYPKAIEHNINGFRYIQIPIILTTAHTGGDVKAISIDIARKIDEIVDTNGYYEEMMVKKGSVVKMESLLIQLIRLFHIGMIAVDEVQLAGKERKGKVFDYLLRITASAGVSIMIIGTEDAIKTIEQNEWFSRRFSHLGLIRSDISPEDKVSMESIIKQMWSCQLTKNKTPLTPEIIKCLTEESAQNIDFLTTIFITAQYMAIKSEGTDHETGVTKDIIKKAVSKFPDAKRKIKEGKDLTDIAFDKEKRAAFFEINTEMKFQKEQEKKKLMRQAPSVYSRMKEDADNVFDRVSLFNITDKKGVERVLRKLSSNDPNFMDLDISQKSKRVLAELIRAEEKRNRKKGASNSGKTNSNNAKP